MTKLRRVLERSYREAHPGWTVHRRQEGRTWFVRGDQLDELDVPALFAEYQASGQSGTDWVAAWLEAAKAEDASRHRTLEEAQDEVIPLLKSAKWIEIQDLGAITSTAFALTSPSRTHTYAKGMCWLRSRRQQRRLG